MCVKNRIKVVNAVGFSYLCTYVETNFLKLFAKLTSTYIVKLFLRSYLT